MKEKKEHKRVTKPKKWRPGQLAITEIKKYQDSVERLIPYAPFYKTVKSIMLIIDPSMKIQSSGIQCI